MTEPEDSAADAPPATHRGLRAEAERLRAAGLTPDEALLVAARRLAGGDPEVRVLARERFAGIWDEPEPDAGLTDSDERGTELRGFWIMAAFAAAAAVAVRLAP